MTSSASSLDFASPRSPESPVATRLANSLRHCRLSVLYAEAGAGKTTLLLAGLLPLLRRRASDAAIPAAVRGSPVILPFPERRSVARARLAELVVFFDRWDEAPLAGLHDSIDAALRAAGVEPQPVRSSLPDRVTELADRHGSQLLLVLDGFERFLQSWNAVEPNALADDLVQLLNRHLPANVLIALRSDSGALFAPLCDRLFAVDAEVLLLPHWCEPAVVPTPTQAQPGFRGPVPASIPHLRAVTRRPTTIERAEPTTSLHLKQIYADIAGTLARNRGLSCNGAWVDDDGTRPVAPGAPPVPSRPLPAAVPPMAAGTLRARWPWAIGLCTLALCGLLLVLAEQQAVDPPLPSLGNAPPPAAVATRVNTSVAKPAGTAPALPVVDLQVDAEGGAPPRLPAELARALAGDAQVSLRLRSDGDAEASRSHLSIVRYDALRSAAAQDIRPNIGVVAPLYTEELYVVVRAASPLRFIHQIQGRRINVGPEFGGRALTAQTIYQRMFGNAMPGTRDAHLAAPAALAQLLQGDTLDAVLLVEPQPASTLKALSPEMRRGLRLLPLDPNQASSRRAVQAYLPATLRDAADIGTSTPKSKPTTIPTLASMTFLVANAAPDAGQSAALVHLAQSICRVLPALQRDADPKWREVQPGLQLDTGWPADRLTAAAWRACSGAAPPSTPTRVSNLKEERP